MLYNYNYLLPYFIFSFSFKSFSFSHTHKATDILIFFENQKGTKDTAFYRPLCYDGLDDYLTCSDSSLIDFPTMGHWSMIASPGRDAVNEIIQWVVDGGDLKQKVKAWYPQAKFEIQKMK